jgi:hypothetical protein
MYPWLSHYVKWRWDGFQHSSTCCHARVGSCGHVPLCKAINVSASRDPDAGRAYPVLEAMGGLTKCLSPSQVREGGRTGRWVMKSCLPTCIVMRKSEGVDCSRVFLVGGPSSLASSGGAISGMGCIVLRPFAAGGNRL